MWSVATIIIVITEGYTQPILLVNCNWIRQCHGLWESNNSLDYTRYYQFYAAAKLDHRNAIACSEFSLGGGVKTVIARQTVYQCYVAMSKKADSFNTLWLWQREIILFWDYSKTRLIKYSKESPIVIVLRGRNGERLQSRDPSVRFCDPHRLHSPVWISELTLLRLPHVHWYDLTGWEES